MTGSDAATHHRLSIAERSDVASASRAAALANLRLTPLGDAAVTIVLGHEIDRATNSLVHAVATSVRAAALPWAVDIVPAYTSLAVHYDPLYTNHATVLAALDSLARATLESGELHRGAVREHTIQVRYDGIDLDAVARATGLSPDEVVALHSEPLYTVYMLGFVPGFAYLGDLHPALVLERRAEPRASVAPGSVAIAGRQSAIYPLRTPGGWHIIGNTDFRPFEAGATPPCRLAAGDAVRFVAEN